MLVIAIGAAVLFVVGRSGAAISQSSGAVRRRHMRNIALAALVLVVILFLMKGAGFVVGIGLLLPLVLCGIAVILFGLARRATIGRK